MKFIYFEGWCLNHKNYFNIITVRFSTKYDCFSLLLQIWYKNEIYIPCKGGILLSIVSSGNYCLSLQVVVFCRRWWWWYLHQQHSLDFIHSSDNEVHNDDDVVLLLMLYISFIRMRKIKSNSIKLNKEFNLTINVISVYYYYILYNQNDNIYRISKVIHYFSTKCSNTYLQFSNVLIYLGWHEIFRIYMYDVAV